MCEKAKALLLGYLDALEEFDRVRRMVLASSRHNDREAADGYRLVLSDGRTKLSVARCHYQQHQVSHACSDAMNFENFSGSRA
jgi:hypothetical protein